MRSENKIKIFLVDDDAVLLKSLEIDFSQKNEFIIETYSTGELCLQNMSRNPDIIILDYHLDSIEKKAMNGLDTLKKIKSMNPDIPVIILSSQDKIEVAVNCMHFNAHDYVVKSETAFFRLDKIIHAFLKERKIQNELNWYMQRA